MHHALEIVEIRQQIAGFVDPSALLPLAKTCKIFTEFALRGLYEETAITSKRLKKLMATTLLQDAKSRVLLTADCDAFFRVARHTLKVAHLSEFDLTSLPRIIPKNSSILFPKLQHLALFPKIEQVWYPAIQAYLPPTLQCLSLQSFGVGYVSLFTRKSRNNQQPREFLKYLAERPEKESLSLSELHLELFDTTLDEEISSYLTCFIRTQHKLETLQLDSVPSDLWPFLSSHRHLHTLMLLGCCIPFDTGTEVVYFNRLSRLEINLVKPWPSVRRSRPGVIFTNIQELFIQGTIEYLISLTKTFEGSRLKKVRIKIRGYWNTALVKDLLCNLRSVNSGSMIPISFDPFRPILRFPLIVDLTLDTPCGIDLKDGDLVPLTESLPDLQRIFIKASRCGPFLTLYGLRHFMKCSQMRSIKVGFLPVLPSGTQIPPVSSSRVEIIIDTGHRSLSEDELEAEKIVAFLEAVFLYLKCLKCSLSSIICDAHPRLSGREANV
ncbi:hypothetical protein DL96DRAFT_1822818 [Flagelloscypha sp. PMI_526]|nr:hypothetical protein DL96DRAFT_1822818 [Flagelloscypha sp. PMI_526]